MDVRHPEHAAVQVDSSDLYLAESCTFMDKGSLLLSSGVLPVILQHQALLQDVAALCQLLKASKAVQAAVLQHCRGQLDVSFSFSVPEFLGSFIKWLAKYACLLGILELQPLHWWDPDVQHHAEYCLVAALQHCARQHGSLALKGFTTCLYCQRADALLQTFSASSLLHLSMGCSGSAALSIENSNLSDFHQLRSLSLRSLIARDSAIIIQTLSSLTNLTCLEFSGSLSSQQMSQLQQQLPTSLVKLSLHACNPDEHELQQLAYPQLQHLQQLRSLEVRTLLNGCQLPEQLQSLSCADFHNMQALQQCSQLQELEITHSSATAAEWQKLSTLTTLTNIRISLHNPAAEALTPAFGQPPLSTALRSLEFHAYDNVQLQTPTLQSLRWLTALTSLKLSVLVPMPGSPAELGAALQHLTALQRLELYQWPTNYLFEAVQQQLLAPPLTTDQALAQLGQLLVDQQTQQAAAEALQPHLYSLLTQAANQEPPHGMTIWQAFVAAVTADPVAVQQLHEALQQLHDQQVLPEVWEQQDLHPLVEVIAGLPLLNSLKLKGKGLSPDVVQPLTRVTQLTRLTIAGDGFDDFALIKLTYALTNLQRLSISNSSETTDAALLVIGQVLSQLTELELTDCQQITERGVAELTGLRRLKILDAIETSEATEKEAKRVLRAIAAQR